MQFRSARKLVDAALDHRTEPLEVNKREFQAMLNVSDLKPGQLLLLKQLERTLSIYVVDR